MNRFIGVLLSLLDRLAGAWLDWRQDQRIRQMQREMPEMSEAVMLKKLEVGSEGWNIAMTHPGVYLMADEFAGFLDANRAENYVQFDMMPRLDRGKHPIRVTVAWASGESPAHKASRLEEELRIVRGAMEAGDKRLRDAGLRVGIIDGCDNPDALADEIEALRAGCNGK